jgi:VanZ family protein
VLTGALELAQLWVPGRHARLEDFIVDALTACAGFVAAAMLDRFARRARPEAA